MRGVEQLLARFDRAGAGDHHDIGTSDSDTVDVHDGTFGLHLAADQLEGLRNGHDIVDSWGHLQGFDLVAASAAHGGYDSAFRAARDVRLVAGFTNAFDHMRDLLFRGFFRHVNDHWSSLFLGLFAT